SVTRQEATRVCCTHGCARGLHRSLHSDVARGQGARPLHRSRPVTCSVSRTSLKFLGLSSTMRMSSFAMTHRNCERERRALPHLTLHPDPSAMEFDELAAEGQ